MSYRIVKKLNLKSQNFINQNDPLEMDRNAAAYIRASREYYQCDRDLEDIAAQLAILRTKQSRILKSKEALDWEAQPSRTFNDLYYKTYMAVTAGINKPKVFTGAGYRDMTEPEQEMMDEMDQDIEKLKGQSDKIWNRKQLYDQLREAWGRGGDIVLEKLRLNMN
jgi:hypothetical protein